MRAGNSEVGPVGRLLDLSGRRVLVTGGATGLGRAIAAGLTEYGAAVMIAGRRADKLDEARDSVPGAAVCVADLTDLDDVQRLFATAVAELDGIDILVNNAGVTVVKPSVELTGEEWATILDTNLRAAFFLSAHFARHRIESGEQGGAIVNISSVGALQGGAGVYTAYSASKGGLVSLTRAQASEWARHGIRVNCIAAGAFPTEMSQDAYADPAIREKYLRRIPLRRVGDPTEIAPLAVYLASDASAFMTGEVIALDGGQVMQ